MPVDKSNTERLRRKKGEIQAARFNACRTCPEEGPRSGTDESTRLSRAFGQMEYITTNAVGASTATSCCGVYEPMMLDINIPEFSPSLRQRTAKPRAERIRDLSGGKLGRRARDASGNKKAWNPRVVHSNGLHGAIEEPRKKIQDISGRVRVPNILGKRARDANGRIVRARDASGNLIRARDASGSIISARASAPASAPAKKAVKAAKASISPKVSTVAPKALPPFSPRLTMPANTLVLPIVFGESGGSVVVNWGDSVKETFTSGPVSHTYATPGEYKVSIAGPWIAFGNAHATYTGAEYITAVTSWGTTRFTSLAGAFNGAMNLTSVPNTLPPTVTDTSYMFYGAAAFNGDVAGWNTIGVTDMSFMFNGATGFARNISAWNVTNVENASGIFTGSGKCPSLTGVPSFAAGTIGRSTLGCVDVDSMVLELFVNPGDVLALPVVIDEYEHDIVIDWGDSTNNTNYFNHTYEIAGYVQLTISAINGGYIQWFRTQNGYQGAALIRNLSQWGDLGVEMLEGLFYGATNLASVPDYLPDTVFDTSFMFYGATSFNSANIANWDTSNVDYMNHMFFAAKNFNVDISEWQPGEVENMSFMFCGASSFNQNIGVWDVSEVNDMTHMFAFATSFNQPLGGWNPQNVDDMSFMFYGATSFDQDLSRQDYEGPYGWYEYRTENVDNANGMFLNCPNMCANPGHWPVFDYSEPYGLPSLGCVSSAAMVFTLYVEGDYVELPIYLDRYDSIVVDWGNGSSPDVYTWNDTPSHYYGDYGFGGYVQVTITGKVSALGYEADFDSEYWSPYIVSVGQWGNIQGMYSLEGLFQDARLLALPNDIPSSVRHIGYLFNNALLLETVDISNWDTSNIVYMYDTFEYSTFNGDISMWDVSNVVDMSYMFAYSTFNGDISNWNTGKVIYMYGMFRQSVFNGDISKWDVSNVYSMYRMFYMSEFNGDISNWNTNNVDDMARMFEYAKFTGDISKWDTSNVEYMYDMFRYSNFIGDLSKWNVENTDDFGNMFQHSPMCLIENHSKWPAFEYDSNLNTEVGCDPYFRKSQAPPFNSDTNGNAYGEGYCTVYANGLWVAGGYDHSDTGKSILYTTDATGDWFPSPGMPFGDYGDCKCIAYGNGLWVAGGYYNGNGEQLPCIVYTTDPRNGWSYLQGNPDRDIPINYPFGVYGNCNGIAYANGLWVAVGQSYISDGTTIMYTTNPTTGWFTSPYEPFGSDYSSRGQGIAYGNGLWIAVGCNTRSANQILYSRNPVDGWTASGGDVFGGSGDGKGVAYGGNGRWVVVGYNSDNNGYTIVYSSNPIDDGWDSVEGQAPFGNRGYGVSIAYGNNRWVATGYSENYDDPDTSYGPNIIFSINANPADGWTSNESGRRFPNNNTYTERGYGNGVAYGNGEWVAVGYDAGGGGYTIVNSDDPTAYWNASIPYRPFAGGDYSYANAIAYGNGLWVTVGDDDDNNGTGSIVYTTDPKLGWQVSGYRPFGYDGKGNCVAYGNGLWVAGGYDASEGYYLIISSTDPASGNWYNSSNPSSIQDFDCRGVAYGNNLWVAVGYDYDDGNNTILTSMDPSGEGWTRSPGRLFGPDYSYSYGNAVAYANGLWVAVGYNDICGGVILYSRDPTVGWSTLTNNTWSSQRFNAVAYGNGVWLAGSNNTLVYSTDPEKGWTVVENENVVDCDTKSIVYTGKSWAIGDSCGYVYFTLDPTTGMIYKLENSIFHFCENEDIPSVSGLASANGLTVAVGYDDCNSQNIAITEDL